MITPQLLHPALLLASAPKKRVQHFGCALACFTFATVYFYAFVVVEHLWLPLLDIFTVLKVLHSSKIMQVPPDQKVTSKSKWVGEPISRALVHCSKVLQSSKIMQAKHWCTGIPNYFPTRWCYPFKRRLICQHIFMNPSFSFWDFPMVEDLPIRRLKVCRPIQP